MITYDKLYCQLNEESNFDSGIRQIYGIGCNNQIYKKFGLSRNAHAGVLKIVSETLEFDIEYYISKKRQVSYQLQQIVENNIKRKILQRTYKGSRHQAGLPVRGQRTHSNCKTVKKTFNKDVVLSTGFKTPDLAKKKPQKSLKKKPVVKIASAKNKKKNKKKK